MNIDRPIAIGLTLFAILLLVFFLVAPEYKTFRKLQVNLGEKIAEYNEEFAYYNAIAVTYAQLENRKEDIKKIDDALPQDPALGKLVYSLQETAKENGLIVKDLFLSKTSLSNSAISANSGVKDVVFSMDLMGDYPSLENFIISLEKSARIFEVNSISFGSSSKLPYSFSLQIKTHSY